MDLQSLLDLPVPPKPDYFGPDGAPPGFDLRLDAYELLLDGYAWVDSRPQIQPELLTFHTNGADHEGTVQSAINWGRSGRNRTKPHYAVNWPRPAKLLPTDLRAIGNSTEPWIEDLYGVSDSSFWSIVVETADMGKIAAKGAGYDWPADCGPFLGESVFGSLEMHHLEACARLAAYESIVWGFPLEFPDEADFANATGVCSHTDPWPYPYLTTVPGKTCPGTTKKDQVRDLITPRARLIKAVWLDDRPEDDMTQMNVTLVRHAGTADVKLQLPIPNEEAMEVWGLTFDDVVVLDPLSSRERAELEAAQGYKFTPGP